MAYPYLRTHQGWMVCFPPYLYTRFVVVFVFGYLFLYIMLCVCNVFTALVVSLLVSLCFS
jgi:hypothetical protein